MGRFDGVEFVKPHVLIVEGLDDANLIVGLLSALDIDTVQVVETKGVNNFAPRLGVFKKTSGFNDVTRLGVLHDSDVNPAARLASIRNTLTANGFATPPTPMTLGLGQPAVLYSTTPSPTVVGCLEDLIAQSLAAEPTAACVNAHLACAGLQPLPWSSRWAKAWVHAYLSSSGTPGLKIGEAVLANQIPLANALYDDLREFLALLSAP